MPPMYRVIGSDGKEYGPVSGDQIRAWLKESRLTADTRVCLEGTIDWKTLKEFPELAAALAVPQPPAPPPAFTSEGAEQLAAEILARDYRLDIGSCLGRGWNLVMANFWPAVGITTLGYLLLFAAGSVPFATLFLAYILMGGVDWYFLKLIRGQRAEIGDLFSGFNLAFVPLMLFSIVGQLLVGVGLVLCLLPGIYLIVAWLFFTALLILDKRLDFWAAMEVSRKVVTRHWWTLFGFLLVQVLLTILGTLCCIIGLFLVLPVITAASVYAYEDIFNPGAVPGSALPQAPVKDPSAPAPTSMP